jgi:hypothetical protein
VLNLLLTRTGVDPAVLGRGHFDQVGSAAMLGTIYTMPYTTPFAMPYTMP